MQRLILPKNCNFDTSNAVEKTLNVPNVNNFIVSNLNSAPTYNVQNSTGGGQSISGQQPIFISYTNSNFNSSSAVENNLVLNNVASASNFVVPNLNSVPGNNLQNSRVILGGVQSGQQTIFCKNIPSTSIGSLAGSIIDNSLGTFSTVPLFHLNGGDQIIKAARTPVIPSIPASPTEENKNKPATSVTSKKKISGKIVQVRHFTKGLSCEGRSFQCKNASGEPKTR